MLIAAKNDFAHAHLAAQLKDHSLARTYECIVCGNLREDSGTIDAPIGRDPVNRKKMAVTEKNSRNAVTHWEVIAGDTVYGHKKPELGQSSQCLHARELTFVHPRTGERMTVRCELPDYFTALLEKLGKR